MKLCNVKRRRQRLRQGQKINRCGKTGNNKRATFCATLLQNELNGDVARFIPCKKKTLQETGLNVGGKTCKIANELVLHQCCKTSCRFFFFFFSV